MISFQRQYGTKAGLAQNLDNKALVRSRSEHGLRGFVHQKALGNRKFVGESLRWKCSGTLTDSKNTDSGRANTWFDVYWRLLIF